MLFTERIRFLLSEKGVSINKMLSELSLGGGTFATWEKRNNIPNGDVLSALADYFGVSVDYLLGRTAPAPARQVESTFTPAEQELVGRYRRASGDDRAIVDMALRKYKAPSLTQTEQVG